MVNETIGSRNYRFSMKTISHCPFTPQQNLKYCPFTDHIDKISAVLRDILEKKEFFPLLQTSFKAELVLLSKCHINQWHTVIGSSQKITLIRSGCLIWTTVDTTGLQLYDSFELHLLHREERQCKDKFQTEMAHLADDWPGLHKLQGT